MALHCPPQAHGPVSQTAPRPKLTRWLSRVKRYLGQNVKISPWGRVETATPTPQMRATGMLSQHKYTNSTQYNVAMAPKIKSHTQEVKRQDSHVKGTCVRVCSH